MSSLSGYHLDVLRGVLHANHTASGKPLGPAEAWETPSQRRDTECAIARFRREEMGIIPLSVPPPSRGSDPPQDLPIASPIVTRWIEWASPCWLEAHGCPDDAPGWVIIEWDAATEQEDFSGPYPRYVQALREKIRVEQAEKEMMIK
jgi:hypothetical protein